MHWPRLSHPHQNNNALIMLRTPLRWGLWSVVLHIIFAFCFFWNKICHYIRVVTRFFGIFIRRRQLSSFIFFSFFFRSFFISYNTGWVGKGGEIDGKLEVSGEGGLKMFVVMFVLFVFAILCLCLFSFFRSLTKAMCEL